MSEVYGSGSGDGSYIYRHRRQDAPYRPHTSADAPPRLPTSADAPLRLPASADVEHNRKWYNQASQKLVQGLF